MKELFHILADQGKAITKYRQSCAKLGIYQSAVKVELLIQAQAILKTLKEKFYNT